MCLPSRNRWRTAASQMQMETFCLWLRKVIPPFSAVQICKIHSGELGLDSCLIPAMSLHKEEQSHGAVSHS